MEPTSTQAATDTPPSETPKTDAVAKAAEARDPRELTPTDVADATAWFMEEDSEEVASKTFELNVGVKSERWIRWTVQAIDRDRIRQIRKMSQPRAARRGGAGIGSEDEMLVNLRIAAEGTLDPDLHDPKLRRGIADPAEALRMRFHAKPGLIDQIAGEVLSVSGYDDEDIREVKAAKN